MDGNVAEYLKKLSCYLLVIVSKALTWIKKSLSKTHR